RARDRQGRRRAAQQPGERDLLRRCAVAGCDVGERRRAAAAQREERNEWDAFAGAVLDDRLVLSLAEAVVVLDGGDRDHLASRADLLDAHLGDADVADPAL